MFSLRLLRNFFIKIKSLKYANIFKLMGILPCWMFTFLGHRFNHVPQGRQNMIQMCRFHIWNENNFPIPIIASEWLFFCYLCRYRVPANVMKDTRYINTIKRKIDLRSPIILRSYIRLGYKGGSGDLIKKEEANSLFIENFIKIKQNFYTTNSKHLFLDLIFP